MIDLELLRYMLLDEEAADVAERLYGDTWDEVVRFIGRSTDVEDGLRTARAARAPLPRQLTKLFGEVLVDVAHDGRAGNANRALGWWHRRDGGPWEPTSIGEIAFALGDAVEELKAEAVRERREAEHDRTSKRFRDACLRVAVLSGLAIALDSAGRNVASAMVLLRDRLAMPADARRDMARHWLDRFVITDADSLEPGPEGTRRLAVETVRSAYKDDRNDASARAIPLHTLFAGLDDLLGARVPASRPTHWRFDERALEGPQAAESATPETDLPDSEGGAR